MNDSTSLAPPVVAPVSVEAPTLRTYLGISLFWFAIAFFWGAMLILVLPHRVLEMVGESNAGQKDHVLALVTSIGAFVSGITQIVFGALSDNCTHRLGRRRPYLVFGVLTTSVLLLFLPNANTVWALLGVMVGIQFFLNVANGPYQALMPDLIPRDYHGRASAFMGVSLLLGRIGGPLVAALLLNRPNGLFYLTIIFIVVLNALMWANVLMLKEDRLEKGEGVRATLVGLKSVPLRPYPDFLWLLVSRFGITLGVYTILPFLEYYVHDTLGVPKENVLKVVAGFSIVATVAGLFGTVAAGFASDRFPKKRILFVANGIAMVAAAGFALAQNTEQAYVAIAIFGAGFGTFAAVDWALAAGLLPPGAPAKYMGFWSLSDTLPQVVAPVLAGPLAAYFNNQVIGSGYRWLMAAAIFYFALGTYAITFVREPKHTLLEEFVHQETAQETADDVPDVA